MRQRFLLAVFLSISGLIPANTALSQGADVEAVYLTAGPGVLSKEDLARHPEVVVVSTSEQLKSNVSSRVSVWIDTNAIHILDYRWAHDPPQRYYPWVIVGVADVRKLPSGMSGPAPAPGRAPEPGFGMWMLTREDERTQGGIPQNFKEKPTVEGILKEIRSLWNSCLVNERGILKRPQQAARPLSSKGADGP